MAPKPPLVVSPSSSCSNPAKGGLSLHNLISSPVDCFSCDDWDLCTLFSSWTGSTDSTSGSSSSPESYSKEVPYRDLGTKHGWKDRRRLPSSRSNEDGHGEGGNVPFKSNSFSMPLARHRVHLNKTKSRGSSHDHPPPVIALSRSSFSIGSSSSTESALETTEVDRYQDEEKRRRQMDLGAVTFWLKGRHRGHVAVPRSSGTGDAVSQGGHLSGSWNEAVESKDSRTIALDASMDFAARHELLLNALFEDAMHRHEAAIAGGGEGASIANATQGSVSRPLVTPPRPHRKSSVGTATDTPGGSTSISGYSKSSLSRSSRVSSSTTGSDLLNPSCHQFTNKLQKTKRKCQHRTLCAIKQRSARRRSSPSKQRSRKCQCSSVLEDDRAMMKKGKEEGSVASSTTLSHEVGRSSTGGELAKSFLHPVCRLQKDSGKGLEPGTAVSVSGRDAAIKKLMEKMDLLAEVEQDGTFGNAVLTRIQAKNMTLAKSEVNAGSDPLWEQGFVETRSMLAVKMGFMSLRYGIMIHWNRQTGLAELIVLRKMCPDSFMKVKMESKSKSWKKRTMRRMSAVSTTAMEESKISVAS